MALSRNMLGAVEVVMDKATLEQMSKLTETENEEHKGVIIALLGLIFILLFGTIVYSLTEAMTFVDAMYFTIVTSTTVGFGDYVPQVCDAIVLSETCNTCNVLLIYNADTVTNTPTN